MGEEAAAQLRAAIDAVVEEHEADVLLLNAPMMPGLENKVRTVVEAREGRRERLVLFLVSTGGSADEAYRCARLLQGTYSEILICVAGWCKSAGTLLAIGGGSLYMGPRGELGPLDVQIAKRDELFDRDSGLISNAALDRLREESFQFFEQTMLQIKGRSQNSITFRTAADVAAELTVGLLSPIFEKIEPLRLGADARAMEIGSAYAIRLNMHSDNLRGNEALNMLLNGYPSHSFVIDLPEAEGLFRRVKPLTVSLSRIVEILGALVIDALDESVVCFLDGGNDGKAKAENEPVGETAEGDDGAAANDPGDAAPEVISAAVQGDPRPKRTRGG